MAEQQQTNPIKISSLEEVKQFWEDNAQSYLSKDQAHNGFYFTLINMLKLEERKNILEVGAGGGYLYNHSLQRKLPEANYYATDISDQMLEALCKRMGGQYTPNQTTYIPNYKLHISNANGEQLPFNDETFDCYICNLCLQITTNPDKMLSEAIRVLQKGGYAGFTVWGDKEKSKFFTLSSKILSEQFGIQIPQVRNSFHLNDKNQLIKLLEDAGFTNIICWNQFQPFPYIDEQDIQALFTIPSIKDSLKKAGDKQEEFKKALIKQFQQIIINNREPIGLDGLMIIAKKP